MHDIEKHNWVCELRKGKYYTYRRLKTVISLRKKCA